jgi:hypothetical protein
MSNEISVESIISALSAKVTRAGKNQAYTVALTGDTKAKLAPQARAILVALLKDCSATNTWERTDEDIRTILESLEMKTKQDKMHVFKYYRSTMVEAGFLILK